MSQGRIRGIAGKVQHKRNPPALGTRRRQLEDSLRILEAHEPPVSVNFTFFERRLAEVPLQDLVHVSAGVLLGSNQVKFQLAWCIPDEFAEELVILQIPLNIW